MDVSTDLSMTQEQFFAWAQSHEGRYEFDGSKPIAVTGGTGNHGLISGNLMYQLKGRLRGSSCIATGSEGPGVSTIGPMVRYPDAVVTRTRFGGRDRLVPNPVIVFEILSETSLHTDNVPKRDEYQAVPSIKRYVVVEQTKIGIVVHVRKDSGPWRVAPLFACDVVELPEIGIEIPVADIYEGVSFGESAEV